MTPIARTPGVSEPNPRGAELNRVCIAFTATAALFVAFRISIRGHRKVLGLDDLWIVLALVSYDISSPPGKKLTSAGILYHPHRDSCRLRELWIWHAPICSVSGRYLHSPLLVVSRPGLLQVCHLEHQDLDLVDVQTSLRSHNANESLWRPLPDAGMDCDRSGRWLFP